MRRVALVSWMAVILVVTTGHARAADRVYPTPEAVEPLAPGAQVPSALLISVAGEPVELRDLVENRGAMLVFYRGGW